MLVCLEHMPCIYWPKHMRTICHSITPCQRKRYTTMHKTFILVHKQNLGIFLSDTLEFILCVNLCRGIYNIFQIQKHLGKFLDKLLWWGKILENYCKEMFFLHVKLQACCLKKWMQDATPLSKHIPYMAYAYAEMCQIKTSHAYNQYQYAFLIKIPQS